jgi:hypothetical protein
MKKLLDEDTMTRWQEEAQILRGAPLPSARHSDEMAPLQPSYAKASVAIAIGVLIVLKWSSVAKWNRINQRIGSSISHSWHRTCRTV